MKCHAHADPGTKCCEPIGPQFGPVELSTIRALCTDYWRHWSELSRQVCTRGAAQQLRLPSAATSPTPLLCGQHVQKLQALW
jgi:hypothetical protein